MTDVIVAQLIADGRAVAASDGLRSVPTRDPASGTATTTRTAVDLGNGAARIVDTVAAVLRPDEPIRLASFRYYVGTQRAMWRPWGDAAVAGMLRSRWSRHHGRMWLAIATFLTAIAIPMPFAFAMQTQPPRPVSVSVAVLVVGAAVVGPFAVLGFAEWRRGRLTGYGPDPRTPAGLQAIEIARSEPWATSEAWRTALDGLGGTGAVLLASPNDPTLAPTSRWHVARDSRSTGVDDGTGWTAFRLSRSHQTSQ